MPCVEIQTILTSKVSAEGGSVGRRVLASRHNETSGNTLDNSPKHLHGNDRFVGHENANQNSNPLTAEHDFLRSVRLNGQVLYVQLPEQLSAESKEKFVSLLEFAEDKLQCKHMIVYFDKARSDRASLVKTFMFLGFHLLSPDNRLMKKEEQLDDQIYMLYQIDG